MADDVLGVADRSEIDAYLTTACGAGIPMFGNAETQEQAMHGLAYLQRQILSTNSYKVHIGQTNAAVSAIQWMLDRLAVEALSSASMVRPDSIRGWRDIESAPKDGTRVIATDGEEVQESYFDPKGEGWCSTSPQSHLWSEPTHWMPLPPPPSLSPDKRGEGL